MALFTIIINADILTIYSFIIHSSLLRHAVPQHRCVELPPALALRYGVVEGLGWILELLLSFLEV